MGISFKNKEKRKQSLRVRRAHRVRTLVRGNSERPRLSVQRSLKHIRVQIIDDIKGKTLVSASDTEIKAAGTKSEIATEVGKLAAQKAQKAGIAMVVFDRGSNRYHGRVKALAEGARAAGLTF